MDRRILRLIMFLFCFRFLFCVRYCCLFPCRFIVCIEHRPYWLYGYLHWYKHTQYWHLLYQWIWIMCVTNCIHNYINAMYGCHIVIYFYGFTWSSANFFKKKRKKRRENQLNLTQNKNGDCFCADDGKEIAWKRRNTIK